MAGEDILYMSQKELKRMQIIQKHIDGQIGQQEAGRMLRMSVRHVRRMAKRIMQQGAAGVISRRRGKASNRAVSPEERQKILGLYRQKYWDFAPTLAVEKLWELDGIKLSKETLRKWLIASGDWKTGKAKKKHCQWRQRRSRCGYLLQLDGSHHDWFEGRREKCVLMAYIDDATSRVSARFYEYEGTIPAMDSFMRYDRQYGLPHSIYVDKHSTYKSPDKQEEVFDEDGNEIEALSQFQRVLQELSVEVIHAHSPQAKGRVERLFDTLQDRLVKELRLRGISSIEEANRYLPEYFKKHNAQFAVVAAEAEDMHRSAPSVAALRDILCIKTERTVRNDNTIAHERKLYQLEEALAGKKVLVEERVDGTMRIKTGDKRAQFRQIEARPQRKKQPTPLIRKSTANKPSADHPWRRYPAARHICTTPPSAVP